MAILVTEHRLPVRRACRAVGLSRTAWYRRPADPATRDAAVIAALLGLVEQHGRWGFWKCFTRLRLDRPRVEPQARASRVLHDALYGGRPFRTLNVLDEANREALAIEVGTALPAARVVRVLEQLSEIYGRPEALRVDNGLGGHLKTGHTSTAQNRP